MNGGGGCHKMRGQTDGDLREEAFSDQS